MRRLNCSAAVLRAVMLVWLAAVGNAANGDEPREFQQSDVICGEDLVIKNGYVYVSFEWPFVTESGEQAYVTEYNISLAALSPRQLVNVSDEVEKTWNGFMKMECCNGIPLITPSEHGRAVMETESVLDTLISLSIRDTSTWDAIKLLIQSVNAEPNLDRVLELVLLHHPLLVPTHPFVADHVVSLELHNVSVRQALCAILAQSPVALVFSYSGAKARIEGTDLWRYLLRLEVYENKTRLGLSLDIPDSALKKCIEELDAANRIPPGVLAEHAVVREKAKGK